MKSIYLFIIGIFLLLGIMTGCDKESEGWQNVAITYYVSFNFDLAEGTDQFGNQKIFVEQGTTYDVNKNFTATEGEADVTDKVEISGTVDTNTLGYYTVDYSAVNADGYSASARIGVFVYAKDAPSTDISGKYLADVARTPEYYGPFYGNPATVKKVGPGIFYIDRMIGSYYYDGVGYSIYGGYYVHGFVRLNADNTISYLDSWCPGWGDKLQGTGFAEDGTYDPATGVIQFTSLYVNRRFHVTLTPNN